MVTVSDNLITRAVRHRVLKLARFICLFVCFIFVLFRGSTSGLMLIVWRAVNMSGDKADEIATNQRHTKISQQIILVAFSKF